MQPLLKPTEVARQLGVSRAWIYDAAKTGRIPCVRIGGAEGPLRFVPEDLESWIAEARARWTPGLPSAETQRHSLPGARPRPRPRRRRNRKPPDSQHALL
jgi:excisionase family DNA binding protein